MPWSLWLVAQATAWHILLVAVAVTGGSGCWLWQWRLAVAGVNLAGFGMCPWLMPVADARWKSVAERGP